MLHDQNHKGQSISKIYLRLDVLICFKKYGVY